MILKEGALRGTSPKFFLTQHLSDRRKQTNLIETVITKFILQIHLDFRIGFYTRFFYKNTWFEFQPAVSYFSSYFQPKVFLILFLIFVFEFPEHSSVKT